MKLSVFLLAVAAILFPACSRAPEPATDPLLDSLVFYASFDHAVQADAGGGQRTPRTRLNHETEKGQYVFEDLIDTTVFRIAPDGGVHAGALHATDVLPRNGRIFFPAAGNLPYNPDGWSGTVSFWIKTNPNTMLKTRFCDPVQITQKGATNGGLWVDFPDSTPRDFRLGVFPSEGNGRARIPESDPNAPLVHLTDIGFQAEDWHHIAFTFANLDSGQPNAAATLYIDGQNKGELRDHNLTMAWDLAHTGIYIAVNYIGYLDELAIFDRLLDAAEIKRLVDAPGLIAATR